LPNEFILKIIIPFVYNIVLLTTVSIKHNLKNLFLLYSYI